MTMTAFAVKDGGGTVRNVMGAVDASGGFSQAKIPYHYGQTDNLTTGAGTTIDASLVPVSRFSMQVKGTGAAATAWEVVLEGSLNGTQFTTILTHKFASGVGNADGATVWGHLPGPIQYFRSRIVSVTLGSATNLGIEILGETN